MPNTEPENLLRPPTPPVDAKVASVAARLTGRHQDSQREDDSDSEDADLFEELEKELESDFDMGALREKRMEALKGEMQKVRDMRENEHGRYSEITDEKEVIRVSAPLASRQEARCVIHFYHRNFQRCKIMDKHLEEMAPRYFSTRFFRVFVENVPWLVEKLAIKVLPCVICFMNGVSKDRIVGFEELGNQDGFQTATLEMRLNMSGVLEKPKPTSTLKLSNETSSGIRGRETDEDDFDLDD